MPEHRLAFARRFGGVDLKRFFAAVPGYPMIAEVRRVPEQRRRPDLIKPQTRSA
jgi:taurine dioxygenase